MRFDARIGTKAFEACGFELRVFWRRELALGTDGGEHDAQVADASRAAHPDAVVVEGEWERREPDSTGFRIAEIETPTNARASAVDGDGIDRRRDQEHPKRLLASWETIAVESEPIAIVTRVI